MFSKILVPLSLVATALAGPMTHRHHHRAVEKRAMDCTNTGPHLTQDHCNYMDTIGMFSTGVNAISSDNGNNVWIGNDGPNTFTFTSNKNDSILVFWIQNAGDYQASFVNARQAAVTMTVPADQNVTVSVNNGISGGFSYLRTDETKLTQYGQVSNTWGEYTTGEYATMDVSREVDMNGSALSMKTHNGCISDMETCVFVCNSGVSCLTDYALNNCDAATNIGAVLGEYFGTPSGGCQGWSNGGQITAVLG